MLLTKKIAIGGLSTALVLITISLSYISPTADLALFTLSSLFIAMVVIEADFRTGFSAYIASSLLITAFFGIYYSIPFIVLFGAFPLIKGLIEKYFPLIFAIICKSIYFILIGIGVLFLFREQLDLALTKWNKFIPFLNSSDFKGISIILLIILIGLFVYDYAFTLLISFYNKRISSKIKSSKS